MDKYIQVGLQILLVFISFYIITWLFGAKFAYYLLAILVLAAIIQRYKNRKERWNKILKTLIKISIAFIIFVFAGLGFFVKKDFLTGFVFMIIGLIFINPFKILKISKSIKLAIIAVLFSILCFAGPKFGTGVGMISLLISVVIFLKKLKHKEEQKKKEEPDEKEEEKEEPDEKEEESEQREEVVIEKVDKNVDIQKIKAKCPLCKEEFEYDLNLKKLRKSNKELDFIKCPNCKTPISITANLERTWSCEFCSKKFKTKEEAEEHEKNCNKRIKVKNKKKKCKNCKAEMLPEDNYCPECGEKS